jgi:DNA-binding Lrp family transcriptional regulator
MISYQEAHRMVTAIVMINADRMKIPETAQALAEIEGVAEVYSISGEFDIVAVVRVSEYDQLATLVTENLLKMPSITGTRTHMAFRTYSKHDLEHIFDIGVE